MVARLVFFSGCSNPVAVLVDSRPHCTDVAIHSSLGGQQWRRSERRKQRRRRRRKRRSVGRRSSRRRYRSSAPKSVEDRVTRAGGRRGWINDLPRRAGSGERRGRRRDGGVSLTTFAERKLSRQM